MSVPTEGSIAPDFTLPSTAGREVTLSQFRGQQHVLLAFYPAAFTSTCTTEVCEFSKDFQQFADRGAVVLPISVDAIPSLKAYRAQEQLTVELLSDFKRVVSRAYGVLNEDEFRSRRAYFLVDREGVLRWTWVEAHNGLRRENAELLAQLEAIA